MTKHKHLIIDGNKDPTIMKCLNCGKEREFPNNEPIKYVIGIMKLFEKLHKNCKKNG